MFDTYLLDRAIKKKQGIQEHARLVMLGRVADALKDVRPKLGIREAFIFGSLLFYNQWQSDSDIDVAVGGCSTAVLTLMKVIEDVTGCPVDVLDLDTHPAAASIRRRGMKIYG